MRYVLSLIGNPNARALSTAVIEKAQDTLENPGDLVVLGDGVAVDIPFETSDPEGAHRAAARTLETLPLDVNVVPAESRKKRLLIADMESTIIACECLDELADKVGLRGKISAITARAMRGELDFEPALRERVALLKGLPARALEEVYRERAHLVPGATTLVATMRAHGAYTLLVSGGFTYFTERIMADAGFDGAQANRLLIENGKLSGRVAEPILGRSAKLDALRKAAADRGIPLKDTLAVGDGANDVAMVKAAGLGVAFRAKPLLAQVAAARIVYGDLTALLYLQGYAMRDFRHA